MPFSKASRSLALFCHQAEVAVVRGSEFGLQNFFGRFGGFLFSRLFGSGICISGRFGRLFSGVCLSIGTSSVGLVRLGFHLHGVFGGLEHVLFEFCLFFCGRFLLIQIFCHFFNSSINCPSGIRFTISVANLANGKCRGKTNHICFDMAEPS